MYNIKVKEKFSENIKALRAESNISQVGLAKAIGVTQQCVSEWENMKTEPTLSYLWLLAYYFGVSLDVLCGRADE